MNFAELARLFALPSLNDANRPIRLRLKGSKSFLTDVLLVQSVDLTEALFDGVTGHLTCLCARADLPPEMFLGVPVELQFVTDRGTLRRFCLIATAVRKGQSDGGLTALQLTARDAFALFERRINSRVFINKSVLDIARTLLDEHLRREPSLGRAFDYTMLALAESRYPARAFTFQLNESDAGFLRRLFREEGISWFFRPVAAASGDDTPRHQLVMFDDSWQLPQSVAGDLRYQRWGGVEERDTIHLWSPARQLVAGNVVRNSWDYKSARMEQAQTRSVLDQGETGNQLAAALADSRMEMPHAADSYTHFEQLTTRAIQRHEYEARCVHGASQVRDLAAGDMAAVQGHPELDLQPPLERQHVFVRVRHLARNNLPKDMDGRVQTLLAASSAAGVEEGGWLPWAGEAHAADGAKEQPRYSNQFVAVRRDTPIVPAWNPATDFPPTPPLVAVVVGAPGQVVWCDEQCRFKVRLPGLDPLDHAHSNGAGTNGLDADSAWLRFDFGWAGAGLGVNFPLRVGMEVAVHFQGGNPSRPIIAGVHHNGANPPPRFSHTGGLPGNRFLSGVVTGEINGHSANQLRFDDTTGQLSAQLASDHGQSQLNLGYLTHPRSEGHGEPRGEGFELRSDESGVIRTAKSLLLTAWKRLDAAGNQLDRDEHLGLMEDCLALFKSLGNYAAQHQAAAVDTVGQATLSDDLKGAAGGSNVEPEGLAGEPTLSLTAPAGIAATTPKTLLSYAGVNIDCIAQQHLQYVAGQRYSLNAGQGIGLFAHDGGIQAIAHHGKLLLQSQHDDIEANAATNIKWTATGGQIVGMAKEIVLIAEDGSFIKIGGGITLGTSGSIISKAAGFPHSGPATMSTELPTFGEGSPDQKFKLHYGGDEGVVAALRRFEISLSDGSVVTGKSDANGMTDVLSRDAMHIADIRILTDE